MENSTNQIKSVGHRNLGSEILFSGGEKLNEFVQKFRSLVFKDPRTFEPLPETMTELICYSDEEIDAMSLSEIQDLLEICKKVFRERGIQAVGVGKRMFVDYHGEQTDLCLSAEEIVRMSRYAASRKEPLLLFAEAQRKEIRQCLLNKACV